LIKEIHKTDGTIGYASWERGTNKNTSRLIRQYFPKIRDFSTITQQEIDTALKRLDNRSRKRLGFLTPSQVFFYSSSQALHFKFESANHR